MTIGNKTLGFQFRLTNVTGNSFNALTKQNVKKRVENIVYLQTPPADSVKLAYVGSSEINVNNNLYIGDRSDSLYENSRQGRLEEFISSGLNCSVANTNFIFTQEFKEAESGNIPLYYVHTLESDYSLVVAESIRIYDKNFELVGDDKYKVVLEEEYDIVTGRPIGSYTNYLVFNNLKSSFNESSGEYEVYFIQYTQTIDGVDITITELLNNHLAYKEASFSDLWHSASSRYLKPWIRAYLFSSESLTIEFPKAGDFAIKYEESKKVGVHAPTRTDNSSPWFPRIANGYIYNGQYKYSVPEFSNQAFNPIDPYKIATYVSCQKIDDQLIKLPHELIRSGELFSNLSLEVKLNGVIKYAVTNDSSIDGDDYLDWDGNRVYDDDGNVIKWTSETLLGIDELTGIINVSFHVLDSYDIYATYSYEEKYYELTSLNMNPLFLANNSKDTAAVYIVPESSSNNNLSRQTESIRWVRVSTSGRITSTNQDGSGSNENLNRDVTYSDDNGYRLSGVLGMHYNRRVNSTILSAQEVISGGKIDIPSASNFPRKGWIRFIDASKQVYRYAEYIDKTSNSLLLADDIPYFCLISEGTSIELVNFVDERTSISIRSFAEDNTYTPKGYIAPSTSRYFLLAELSVNVPHSINDAVLIDLRENGGGIIKEKFDEAKAKQPQIQWVNDNGNVNGQIHPGNATIVVKIRAEELEKFTELEIKEMVEESMPLGVKPLIRYYGYAPEIISVIPTDNNWGFGEGPFGEYPFGG